LLAAAIGTGALFYSGWFFYQGFQNDPTLQSTMKLVRANRVAQEVLGNDIVIESVESETFSAATGKGKTVTYSLRLKGNKAEGHLHVLFHSAGHALKIVSMVLTGPDEARYNLTNGQTATPSNSI
jgi:hypothetical protein